MNTEIARAIIDVVQVWHGPILPVLIDYLNQYIPDARARFLVSVLVCISITSLLNLDKLITGDWAGLIGTIGLVFTQAQIMYKLYWEKSDARVAIYGRQIQS
jgi:hypothetical protein